MVHPTIPSRSPRHRTLSPWAFRHRTAGLGVAAAVVLSGGLAACSSDSSSDAATPTTADSSTTSTAKKSTTTTTLVGTLATVSDVFAPPAAAGADAIVSMSITGGATADQLVGVSVAADWAESAELVPATPIDLPATTTVVLSKDGPYIKLTGLKKALETNQPFEITLRFATSPDQSAQGVVREIDEGTT